MTKSQTVANDVAALLRARNPLLWVVTKEEARVERYLFEAAALAGYVTHCWDCGIGVTTVDGIIEPLGSVEISDTLREIRERATSSAKVERGVWLLRDLPGWLQGPIGLTPLRQVRNLARLLSTGAVTRERAQAMIVLTPVSEVPLELRGHATVIEWPLPDREEITATLDAAINLLPEEMRAQAAPNGNREAAIDAAVGLSGDEASGCYTKSLVQSLKVDPAAVAKEKKRIIASEKTLTWFDPLPAGLAGVGGLDVLKDWLIQRKLAFSPEARAYGLPAPKGCLLIGVAGCGKSLTPKAIATAWGWPLLRFDLGAAKGKYIGESERKIRDGVQVVETVGRCVLWIDEIEKALAGSGSGASDGGVASDALGTLLSWMQDRQGEAFVIATANDVSKLPPELLRKGRFDEMFFVDLPTSGERVEVIAAALAERKRELPVADRVRIAGATEGFSGAELAALIPEALFAAFADGAREITGDDVIAAAKRTTPASSQQAETIAKLRDWAKDRCRRATTPVAATAAGPATRTIDL